MAWAAHSSSTAASRMTSPLMACSRAAPEGAIVMRSSIPSAIEEVGCSSVTGAASSRASAASAAAPWPTIASPS